MNAVKRYEDGIPHGTHQKLYWLDDELDVCMERVSGSSDLYRRLQNSESVICRPE